MPAGGRRVSIAGLSGTVPVLLAVVGLSMFVLAGLLTIVQRVTGLDCMFTIWCLLASAAVFALPIAGVASGVVLTASSIGQRGGTFFYVDLGIGLVFALFGVGSMVGFGVIMWNRVVPMRHRELVVSWIVGSLALSAITVRMLVG